MNALQRGLLIVAIVLLGGAAWVWNVRAIRTPVEPPPVKAAPAQRDTPHSLPSHKFTREQGYAFVDAMKKAEAIADPLQRCLAYPDPPDSHWTRETVVAYCHFRLQPLLTFAEAQSLIQQGRSAELDRRLAAALHAQQADPAAGLLDRIYDTAFENGSFDIRPTLDAWKRDSPNSAFAFAASGVAYVSMAVDARGSGYIKDTPDSSIRAMDNLLAQADGDLRQALALNPKLTVAHAALIHAGGLGGGRDYVDAAIRDALAAVPDDYMIYSTAMWTREPKWGGSLQAMDQLAAQAQTQRNPMLKMLLTARPFYEVWNCDCSREIELAAYPHVVDELTGRGNLARIGELASNARNQTMALIYQSEVLRFVPDDEDARVNRAFALIDYDETAWAVGDLGRLLATSPRNRRALDARAYAYEMLGDYAHAEKDFRALLAMDPRDTRTLGKLGDLYVNWADNWDKGWAVADQLIRDQPDNAYGWLLRARIQDRQPRAGLDVTVDSLQSRFGKDPQMARILVRMRAQVALRKHTGIDAQPAAPANALPVRGIGKS
jgi:tetratricopeptide (TPR) repeat protein